MTKVSREAGKTKRDNAKLVDYDYELEGDLDDRREAEVLAVLGSNMKRVA